MTTNTPTLADVAVVLGMHKSTVSKALSGTGNISRSTRDRVRRAARELGYEPNPLAQRLAGSKASPLVYVLSGTLDLGMATQKIRLIQAALHGAAFEAPIHTCPEPVADGGRSQAEQVRQLCRQRPRAIVCAAQLIDADVYPELEAYRRAGGVVVSYDSPVPLACDQVIFDREDNAYQAARRLLEAGHRKIGIGMSRLPERPQGAFASPQSQRLRGFRRALGEFGVPFQEKWLFENPPYDEGGAAMAQRFLAMIERPTGLCIVNDQVAFAFMVDVMRAGVRVPDEVSIVSHDNQPITHRCPVPMTSATQPVEEIVRATVAMLTERLAGYDGEPRTVTIRGELVERASVAAPPFPTGAAHDA